MAGYVFAGEWSAYSKGPLSCITQAIEYVEKVTVYVREDK
jgi:hypothetical protein